ncbi:MAG TPA: tetratricopeptide repeat protein [Gammaproteobacteria bacterium]|nr:tetratricopeptide repeat protein [Gammaproteobacteria bacterium]
MKQKHRRTKQEKVGYPPSDAATAVQLHQAGRLVEAERLYHKILEQHPGDPDILHLLGVLAGQRGHHDASIDLIRKAIAINPRDASYHSNLGRALLALGKWDEAASALHHAIGINPGNPDFHNALGHILQNQGKLESAINHYKHALQLNPRQENAYIQLGGMLEQVGNSLEAEKQYMAALSINPQNPQAHNNLANLLCKQSRTMDAIEHYLLALSAKPMHAPYQTNLVGALKQVQIQEVSPLLAQEITHIFSVPGIEKQSLSDVAISALRNTDNSGFLDSDPPQTLELLRDYLSGTESGCTLEKRLFHFLLRETVVTRPELETRLSCLRKSLLELAVTETVSSHNSMDALLALTCSLAHQCFINEYIWEITSKEESNLARLTRTLTGGLLASEEYQYRLAVFAMYRPLHELALDNTVPDSDSTSWNTHLGYVIERQINNFFREQALMQDIKAITPIEDSISLAVQSQYEGNPYPQWLELGIQQPRSLGTILRGLFQLFDVPAFLDESMEILIAGCGTGRHAISVAATHTDSKVLAIDLSKSSLAYAIRMSEKLHVRNITFRQGDILALSDTDLSFPYIECSGVLHHMENPLAGWKVLVGLLQPGGVMKIALYSEKARFSVKNTREYIATSGFDPTPKGIRACRRKIMKMGDKNPIKSVTKWKDFYSLSECRDLLFHVQEHRFNIDEIRNALTALKLNFIGFELGNPTTASIYRKHFPDDTGMVNLAYWEKFEGMYPDTFANMYQFWCQKA